MKRLILVFAIILNFNSFAQHPPNEPYGKTLPFLKITDSINTNFLSSSDTVVVISLPNGKMAGVLKSNFANSGDANKILDLGFRVDSISDFFLINDSLISLRIDSLFLDTIPIYNWSNFQDSLLAFRIDSTLLYSDQNDSLLQLAIDGYRYPLHIELSMGRNLENSDANTTLYNTGPSNFLITIPSGLSSSINQEYFYFQSRNTGTITLDGSAVHLFDSEGDLVSSLSVDAAAAMVRTGQDTFYIIDAGMMKAGTGGNESDPVFTNNGVKLSSNQTVLGVKSFSNLVAKGSIEITEGDNVAGEDGNWRFIIENGNLKAQKLISGTWKNQAFGTGSSTLAPFSVLRQWRLDLNNEFGTTTPEPGWNKLNPLNVELQMPNGFVSGGLLDSNGQNTNVTFTNTSIWQGSSPNIYPASPDLSGVFSTAIYRGAWELRSTEVEVQFDNLDDSKYYQIYVIAASSSPNLGTTWRANNGTANIIDPLFNNYGSSINEWHSDPSINHQYNVQSSGGIITLQFVKSGTSFLSYVTGIIIEESDIQK